MSKEETIHFVFGSRSLGAEYRREGSGLVLGKTLIFPPWCSITTVS